MKKSIQTALLATAAAAMIGCGEKDYSPTADATGEKMLADACAECHGDGGVGRFGFLLTIAGTEHSAESVSKKISEGGLIMPKFPNFPEEKRLELANYLKEL